MKEVGAFEAKNKLSALLDLVEKGEEIVITRHGRQVARLVPPQRRADPDQVRTAMKDLRERARLERHGAFDWDEWQAYRDEGRR